MLIKFPSDEWIKELSRLLNASEDYEKSSKDWEGDFVFICDLMKPTQSKPISSWASSMVRVLMPG